MKYDEITFDDFLNFFPELELPITLTEESAKDFSMHNKALPGIIIQKYILEENEEWDDLSEIVPCFRVPDTNDFYAMVYWKASLQNYEYILVTYDKAGNFLDGKVIAGMVFNEETIIRTVSTMDQDWIIHVAVGEENINKTTETKQPRAFNMELLGTGEIIFSLNDNQI